MNTLWRVLSTSLKKLAWLLEKGSTGVGMVMLIAMTVITFVSVVMRYVFNSPLAWTEFVLATLMAWSIFLVMGSVTRNDGHIRMGVFLEWIFGEKRAKYVSLTTENLIGLGICAYFFYHGIRWVRITYQADLHEWTSAGFTYPVWIVRIVAPLGLGLITFFYVERGIKQIAGIVRGRRGEAPIESQEQKESIDTGVH